MFSLSCVIDPCTSVVIFARLSELEVGETDVVVTSDYGLMLNYTLVQSMLHAQNLSFASTPRTKIIVQVNLLACALRNVMIFCNLFLNCVMFIAFCACSSMHICCYFLYYLIFF